MCFRGLSAAAGCLLFAPQRGTRARHATSPVPRDCPSVPSSQRCWLAACLLLLLRPANRDCSLVHRPYCSSASLSKPAPAPAAVISSNSTLSSPSSTCIVPISPTFVASMRFLVWSLVSNFCFCFCSSTSSPCTAWLPFSIFFALFFIFAAVAGSSSALRMSLLSFFDLFVHVAHSLLHLLHLLRQRLVGRPVLVALILRRLRPLLVALLVLVRELEAIEQPLLKLNARVL